MLFSMQLFQLLKKYCQIKENQLSTKNYQKVFFINSSISFFNTRLIMFQCNDKAL